MLLSYTKFQAQAVLGLFCSHCFIMVIMQNLKKGHKSETTVQSKKKEVNR